MKTLVETTLPILAIIALPVMFYVGIILGSGLGQKNESFEDLNTELVFEFADETYIDDIPFNTADIVQKTNFEQTFCSGLKLADQEKAKPFTLHTLQISIGVINNFTDPFYLF